MLTITRFKYLLALVVLLSLVAWLLLEYVPRLSDGSLCVRCTVVLVVLTLSALIGQKWTALAALFLLLVGSIVGERWRYLLVVVMLESWLAMHLLNYVSDIAWLVDLLKACWLALLLLAVAAPFFRKWRELVISCLMLFFTVGAFVAVFFAPDNGAVLPNRWLQETGFRIYASHLIRSMSLEEFLPRCKLVDYLEQDGRRQQIGECGDGLRSTLWFEMIVIHDPSGQLARPAIQRTLAWRLAVLHLPTGRFFVHDEVATHLVGNFYWILAPGPL